MKKVIVIAVLALSLTSSAALAQERATDAALGAVSGAVVLGPVGAVAGAIVGYTAGPSISHSWGLRRAHPPRHTHRSARPDAAAVPSAEPALSAQARAPAAAEPSPTPAAPAAPRSASTAPPVQTLE